MKNLKNGSLLQLARGNGAAKKSVASLNLGMRVRELRKAKKWTLEQAAEKVGLARSTLSKIENEHMSPTFDAVKKLAEGLGISVPQLFTPPKMDRLMARMAVTKNNQGKPHLTTTYEHEILAASMEQKTMLPYRTYVRARDISEFDGWVRHDGEEFLYVLSGDIVFYSEHYESVIMTQGDSIYYDAVMGHNIISTSKKDAVILWVTTL